MNNTNCTAFLQWALLRFELHWSGFRKARRQVCKRLKPRAHELSLQEHSVYPARLEADPSEWQILDECCHITISTFFRDRGIFEVVRKQLLPAIAVRAKRKERDVKVWSAECASGEELYTLKILRDGEVASGYPGVSLAILASDVDKAMLARAREGRFVQTCLHELPLPLNEQAFEREGARYCVKPNHREGIVFLNQDIRTETPPVFSISSSADMSPLSISLCRYSVKS